LRDVHYLARQAEESGASIGLFANRLLEAPPPWTRMRAVYALLGLCRRYGNERVEEACSRALVADSRKHVQPDDPKVELAGLIEEHLAVQLGIVDWQHKHHSSEKYAG
jgi:hypothetical protein